MKISRRLSLEKLKKEHIGQVTGELEVIDVFQDENGEYWFTLKCSCGGPFVNIKRKHIIFPKRPSKSCGCLVRRKMEKQVIDNKLSITNDQMSLFNKIYNYYRSGAKSRDLEFSLSKNEFESFIFKKCAYCGKSPDKKRCNKTTSLKFNGIDRLNNLLGYTKSNCVPCCTECNFFKKSMNSEEFVEKVLSIANNIIISPGIKKHKLDSYYKRALAVSENSPDPKTKVGSILIKKDSGAVIASGYNGFARGADDKNIPKDDKKHNYIIHSEQNLLFNCARHGISTKNCAIFVTLSPCKKCTRALYQSGITTIYFKDKYKDFEDQIKLGDLLVEVDKIGDYVKLELKPNKNFYI